MTDQQTIPCGRTFDHEPHDWYSDPSRKCPGVIDAPQGYGVEAIEPEERTPPDFARCGSTYGASRCVRPVGHEEQGTMHVNDSGDGWPAHVPAPGGVPIQPDQKPSAFEEMMKDAEGGGHLTTLVHYGKQVQMVAEARTFRTEIAGVVIAPCDEYGRTEEEKRLRAMLRAAGVAEHFIDGTTETVDKDDADQCDQIGCNQTSGHGGKHGAVL